MSTTEWTVVAYAAFGLRVLGALAVGSRRVPPWSGPVVEVLLWIGGPAIVDPATLGNRTFWLGLVFLLLAWGPALALARRPSERRAARTAVLIVAAVLAVAVQGLVTQGLVAGTVTEATAGRVCQFPRKPSSISGDLFPEPPGTARNLCVQGRPGDGYLGD